MNNPRTSGTLGAMTDLASAPATGHLDTSLAPVAQVTAEVAAADAALTAGVDIVALESPEQFVDVQRLFAEIWSSGDEPPVSAELMRALAHAGNYVVGAYDTARDGALVGACVGFCGPPAEATLHSHIAGVTPSARGRSVGYALKLNQYTWALRHGLKGITWTFDPLVCRNAHLNIAKLGATPTEYLPNFYGAMTDGINAGQGSDRLLVSWSVRPLVEGRRRDDVAPGAVVLLEESSAGRPTTAGARALGEHETGLVRVPRDIEVLRLKDPAAAISWRSAVGEVLGGLLQQGRRITGFTGPGYYVVESARS
jgi:predicted GNAT superfamily acetyltransferase